MKKSYLWTALKARLLMTKKSQKGCFNWVFLPGGPGMGSEYLTELTNILSLPGTVWLLDFPGDGSNLVANEEAYFPLWQEALVEATQALDDVILVAHSTGGMYALATPQLQKTLTGLVLMNSAPDASWQEPFQTYVKDHPRVEVKKYERIYEENPNNDTLRDLTVAMAPYLFAPSCPKVKMNFLNNLPYNQKACAWSGTHFDQHYKAQWFPENIPTLLFSGEEDYVTPLTNFDNLSNFDSPNIMKRTVKSAGHFPWIENPEDTINAFDEYVQALTIFMESHKDKA